jgi:hypothetical protein
MKKLLFILALTAASFAGFAQDEAPAKAFKFSIGVEAGLPVGDWSDYTSFAIGGSVQGDYFVAEDLALTLNAGYLSLSPKSQTIGGVEFKGESTGLIPVLAGIRYFFAPKVYGSAQLGASFSTESGAGTIFTYAPGIGYNFTDNLDATLKYTGFSQKVSGVSVSNSLIGLRVAYSF